MPKGKVLSPGKWKEAEEPGWFLFGELGVRRVEVGWGVGGGVRLLSRVFRGRGVVRSAAVRPCEAGQESPWQRRMFLQYRSCCTSGD